MAMNFFDAAADVIPLGFKVFPLVPGKTMPLVKWAREASDDLEAIADWAERFPEANIAIATGTASGVIVVDIDMKDGKDGRATLERLAKQGKNLPPSPTAITPTGGWHRYFRAVPGIRNVVQITKDGRGLGKGIDVRADGGMVVLPPSWLRNGTAYRWLIPPMTADFPRLPDWAVKMLMPQPQPQAKSSFSLSIGGGDIEPLARFVAASPHGQRNDRTYWAACRARELVARQVISETSAEQWLSKAAAEAGLPAIEALRTIRSGLKGRQQRSAQ